MKFDVITSAVNGDALENGAYIHLRHPTTADPMYRDPATKKLPVRALVRSTQSKTYRSGEIRDQAAGAVRNRQARGKSVQEIVEDSLSGQRARRLSRVLIGLENASGETKGLVTVSPEDCTVLEDDTNSQWMVNQVLVFADDQSNFGADAEGNDAGAVAEET